MAIAVAAAPAQTRRLSELRERERQRSRGRTAGRALDGARRLRRAAPARGARRASGELTMRRLALALTLAALALGAVTGSAQTVGGLQFTDWTATGGTTATGTLLGNTVTVTGWHLSELPASYLDGSATFFSAPYFTPPLPHGDAIEFRAENRQPHDYTLSFSSPTTDPVLHLASLGTHLASPPAPASTRQRQERRIRRLRQHDHRRRRHGGRQLRENDSKGRSGSTARSAITSTATTGYALDGVLLQVGHPCRRPSPPSRRRPRRRPAGAARPRPCAPSTSASAGSR